MLSIAISVRGLDVIANDMKNISLSELLEFCTLLIIKLHENYIKQVYKNIKTSAFNR